MDIGISAEDRTSRFVISVLGGDVNHEDIACGVDITDDDTPPSPGPSEAVGAAAIPVAETPPNCA